jgi:hypothetical protein
MSAAEEAPGFFARVGGVLIAPRATMAEAARAPVGQGTGDVAWLVAARLVATHAPALVRAGLRGVDLGPAAALMGLFGVVQSALPDVLLILVGGVLMSLFSGGAARRAPSLATSLDLAAYAWIPYFAIELLALLVASALGHELSHAQQVAVDAAALLWAAVVWGVALVALRGRAA